MKSIVLNTKLIALFDQGVVSGTNFLSSLLITRYAGLETYGQFVLFWMIFLCLQGFTNAFINLPGQVLAQQQTDPQDYLARNNQLGNVIAIFLLIPLYFGFYIYAFTTSYTLNYGFWLFPVLIVFYLKHEMNRKYFYAQQVTQKALLIDCCQYALQLPALILLAYFKLLNFDNLVLTLTLLSLSAQFTFSIIRKKNYIPFNWKALPVADNWHYGKFLVFTAILQWFSGNIILISAAGILGVSAVGIIRMLQNIMGLFNVLFLTLENIVPVKASWLLKQHGKKHLKRYFKKIILLVGGVYALMLIALKVFGSNLLGVLYGDQFIQYAYLLDGFILLYILVFIGTIAQLLIKSIQENQGIFYAYLASTIAAASLAQPLLSNFQINGVIYGFALLQIITLSFYFIAIKRKLS